MTKVLIVCSGNAPNFEFQKHQAFIYDQVEAIKKMDSALQFDYFFINKKGIKGYLECFIKLRKHLKVQQCHCIHAHFATSALLANLQRRIPVISTFHGSDINNWRLRLVSLLVEILSKKTIYVSEQLMKKAVFTCRHKPEVIPCGVDFQLFVPRSKVVSRERLGLSMSKKYILFSSNFGNRVKNFPLAKAALEIVNNPTIELLELKGYTREEVAILFTAVDLALMTSFSEGSPQFVKEAIACNCPVVSTDVGDVKNVMENIEGCFITACRPRDIAEKIILAINYGKAIDGRKHIRRFDNQAIAQKLIALYKTV